MRQPWFHTHFEIGRQLPTRIEVTTALNGGRTDEKHVLRRSLQPDHCYILDRWYAEFALWNDIVAAASSYVCRIRDNSNLDEVVEERPVSEAARQAGVLSDIVVKLGTSHKAAARPSHPVRVILVKAEPHQKRGGRKGGRPAPPAMASCGSRPTCRTYRPKSLPISLSDCPIRSVQAASR